MHELCLFLQFVIFYEICVRLLNIIKREMHFFKIHPYIVTNIVQNQFCIKTQDISL